MSASNSTNVRLKGTYGSGPWVRIARYFVRRAAIARLRELDDALRDIGLAPSEIEAAVCGIAARKRPSL